MTNWKALAKPDSPYFGEQDFTSPDEIKTVTIASHQVEQVQNESGKSRKGVLRFREGVKPLILNVTNGKTIAKLYGKDADGWIGKRIALYFDPNVRFGRELVGGVRVKAPAAQGEHAAKCADCGEPIQPAGKMTAAQTAAYTEKKYGRALCAACATREAAKAATPGEQEAEHEADKG